MTPNLTRFFHLLTATLCILPLSACATLFGAVTEGQVLEEGTNRPIPDAIVIVRWVGVVPAIGHASSACVHVENATTDKDGRYRTPAWNAPSTVGPAPLMQTRIGPGAYAYKPGYEYVDTRGETVYLKPFTGGRGGRFKYLERTYGSGCGATDGSEKNSIPLLKAQYEEAKSLAQTLEEKRMLEFFLYGLEQVELGFEQAQERHLERVKSK